MDVASSWAAIIKRLRFLSSFRQSELAQQLGVDQGTVSRWERGIYVPDVNMQKRLRDMLHKLEPAINSNAIEAMPVISLSYSIDHFGVLCCCSDIVANEYGIPLKGMRYKNLESLWTPSVRNMQEILYAQDGWKNREIAFLKATIYRISNKWFAMTASPIWESDQLLYFGAETTPPPDLPKDRCLVEVYTKDAMVA